MLRPQLLRRLVRILGLEGIQNFKDFPALPECLKNVLGVGAGAVELRLIAAVDVNAEALQGIQIFLFEMRGKALVTAPGVGNVHIGTADIFVVAVADRLAHVCGDLPAAVIIVPGQQQACLFALLLQCLDNEQRRGDIPEVADVDRAGGAGSRRADIFFLVRTAVDDFLCYLF